MRQLFAIIFVAAFGLACGGSSGSSAEPAPAPVGEAPDCPAVCSDKKTECLAGVDPEPATDEAAVPAEVDQDAWNARQQARMDCQNEYDACLGRCE